MKFFLNFLILATIAVCIKAQDYSHGDQSAWYEEPDWQCNGDLQSPIQLDIENAIKAVGRLQFVGYDVALQITLLNNGHTVELQIQPNTAYVTSFWLSSRYNLHSGHLHWGSSNSFGSDHVVNGKRHSAELHLIHYDGKYDNLDEAAKHKDGLLVLAILLQVSSDQQNGWAGLNPIVTALPTISAVGATAEVDNFRFSNTLDAADFRKFFNYRGSLTTPPCAESVNWFVSPNPIPVTSDVLEPFRTLLDHSGNPIENNYRCLQSTNNRKVLFYIS